MMGAEQPVRRPTPIGTRQAQIRDALENVAVAEFGGYAAGPAIGKYLATFGARVIHVESRARPDGFRLQYPPYKDNRVEVDTSGCFALFNDSKYGVTLNLKHPEGLKLAYRLVAVRSRAAVHQPGPARVRGPGSDGASERQSRSECGSARMLPLPGRSVVRDQLLGRSRVAVTLPGD